MPAPGEGPTPLPTEPVPPKVAKKTVVSGPVVQKKVIGTTEGQPVEGSDAASNTGEKKSDDEI